MHVSVIDVGIGNIDSVKRALDFLGVSYVATAAPEGIECATHILLPGVGAFKAGMNALHNHGMIDPLRNVALSKKSRILGICLGMQLLGEYSQEGNCEGLNILPFRVDLFKSTSDSKIKVPHVGFSKVEGYAQSGLFEGLPKSSDFYFTHSYAVFDTNLSGNVGFCQYERPFVAAFEHDNVCGAQFHPEKSQSNGLRMLHNFFRA